MNCICLGALFKNLILKLTATVDNFYSVQVSKLSTEQVVEQKSTRDFFAF